MSRDEGFAVMDVSTSLLQDPKVRKLQRYAPDRWPVAMIAYVSTMSESWKAGRRVSVEDAWPVGLTFDALAAEALIQVGLVDGSGHIIPRTWRSWFGKAKSRRAKSRADWRKWQQEHRKRKGGVNPDSDPDKVIPSVPPVRSVPSDPSVRPSARAGRAELQYDGPKDPEEERRIALEQASEEFKAGKLTELEYLRRRREMAS